MKKMLLTGAGGWLSNKLLKHFYGRYEITGLLRDEEKKWKLQSNWQNIKFIFHDLQFPIDQSIKNDFDVIIHCAAMKNIETELLNKDIMFRCNVDGTRHICEFVAKNKDCRFIYISTDKAINPANWYGFTKLGGERCAAMLDNYAIVRFGNLFGSSSSLIQVLIKKMFWGENTFQLSHEDSERYFLSWRDAALLIENAINGNEHYYIGKYKSIKIKHLIELLFPDWTIDVCGLRPGEKIVEELDIEHEKVYYSDDEIIAMWEEAKTLEIGDKLS